MSKKRKKKNRKKHIKILSNLFILHENNKNQYIVQLCKKLFYG